MQEEITCTSEHNSRVTLLNIAKHIIILYDKYRLPLPVSSFTILKQLNRPKA